MSVSPIFEGSAAHLTTERALLATGPGLPVLAGAAEESRGKRAVPADLRLAGCADQHDYDAEFELTARP
jgi:hypothetical protein